jgi:FkbM family methyltransferase
MHKERNICIRDFDGNLFFNCALHEHISSQVFWRGSYSSAELSWMGQVIKKDWVFFDIGANKGEFSLFAAKRLTQGKVIAFEPVPSLCAELQQNILLNHFQQVRVVCKGLSDCQGEAIIYNAREKYDNEWNLGTYSIYQGNKTNTAFGKIELMVLDDFVKSENMERLDLMKIDIEGAEWKMLQGARETIARFKPLILVELNAETTAAAGYTPIDILDFLKGFGYRFRIIKRYGRTAELREDRLGKFQNVLCIPED